MHKFSLILIILASLVFSQELTMDQYEDSVKQAKHIEDSLSKLSQATPQLITDTDTSSCLTPQDQLVLDSLDKLITCIDKKFSHIKRIGKEPKLDRLEAIKFYIKQGIITKDSANSYVDLIIQETNFELQGTQYMRTHDCGHSKIRALAHIKKLEQIIENLTNFKLALNNQSYKINYKKL